MWVLASASPRRRELLTRAGAHFITDPSGYEETNETTADIAELVRRQALAKARDVARRRKDGLPVLGADTLVVCGGEILGKPRDRAAAEHMLRLLGGGTHEVQTGLALVTAAGEYTHVERTLVTMTEWPQELLSAYLAGTEWTDKAGAYAIQGTAALVVSGICGSYTNVVGLPVHAVWRLLTEQGVTW